uniref:Uncharacterized protein n=1 Tax=viral metagenome TaxID=1070528 RepID=A0A6H1ZNX1_9ZZZZ
MPDSLASIKELWENADTKDREQYLFKALKVINENMKIGLNKISLDVSSIRRTCEFRKVLCDEVINKKIQSRTDKLVTKTQAKIGGIIILVFSIGLGIGAGYIKWSEIILKAIP